MTKENKNEKVQEAQEVKQNIPLEKATMEQLQAAAFRIGEQIKMLQRQYNEIYQAIVNKQKEE